MTKHEAISTVHTILFVYESGVYENYIGRLSNVIVELEGSSLTALTPKHFRMMQGLLKMGNVVTHAQVRRVVLRIMNDIDRHKEDNKTRRMVDELVEMQVDSSG